MSQLEIVVASEQAKRISVPKYDPLTDSELADIVEACRYGLVLHNVMGIGPNDPRPLPMHVHPATILAMIQEIQEARIQRS